MITRLCRIVGALAAFCALSSPVLAQSDACTVATSGYQATVSTLIAALSNYQLCISSSNGMTDCSAEASAVASEQIAFAAAVQNNQSACGGG